MNATETQPAYDPCAWGIFKGDRVSVSLTKDRAYLTAARGKTRVSVALNHKGVARLLEILRALPPGGEAQ